MVDLSFVTHEFTPIDVVPGDRQSGMDSKREKNFSDQYLRAFPLYPQCGTVGWYAKIELRVLVAVVVSLKYLLHAYTPSWPVESQANSEPNLPRFA